MRKSIPILLILIANLFAMDSLKKVKLDELLELIKQNNLELKAQDYEIEAKNLEKRVVEGLNYGSLDLISTYSKTNHAGYVFGSKLSSREAKFADFGFDQFLGWMQGGMQGDVLSIEPKKLNYPEERDNIETKFSYQVPLYTGGKLSSYLEVAKKLEELSRIDRDQLLAQKIYEAKKGFYDIALLDSFYKHLSKLDENILRLQETVVWMQKEGYAKKIDVLEVEAIRANVLRMKNQTIANKQLALEFLSFLANKKIESIDATFEVAKAFEADTKELLESNLDLKKAQKGIEIYEKLTRAELANYFPVIGAMAESGWNDNTFSLSSDKDYYLVGIQAKINLFSGGSHSANYEAAKVKELKVKTQYELAKSGLALKLTQIQTEIKSLNYDIDSLKKELELNEKIYENYLGRYQEKLVSINDVLIKQSKQIETILKLQEVQNKRNQKIFELEMLLNRGVNSGAN